MNTYEMQARAAKIAKLAAVCRAAGISASAAREGGKAFWMHAAVGAEVKMPSDTTIAAVIAALEKETK